MVFENADEQSCEFIRFLKLQHVFFLPDVWGWAPESQRKTKIRKMTNVTQVLGGFFH